MMANIQAFGAARSTSARVFRKLLVLIALLFSPLPAVGAESFLVLCYHDIPQVASTPYDVERHVFVKQIEYLRQNGYAFISPEELRKARRGQSPLPSNAVLLSFDDGYLSFYHFVFPLLKRYKIPAVISISTSWVENAEKRISPPLMSWRQIREAIDSGYVFLASHTHDLHRQIPYNSAGNVGPASSLFHYDSLKKEYESEEAFRKRISEDLKTSLRVIERETGQKPYLLTWPYGEYNALGLGEAKRLGFEIIFTIDPGHGHLSRLERTNRNMVMNDLGIRDFILALRNGFAEKPKMRAAQIDLDLIVNPHSYEESDRNLGFLIERLVSLGVNTVFLQGFSDIEGTGNIRAVYFPNRVLPVKIDFLSHAVHQIRIRGIKTFVWMPVLSFELPDEALNEALKVRERREGRTQVTTSWYRRLTPFDRRTLEIAKTLYRDLAAHVLLDGILFQDDLYLTEEEDFHPAALKVFQARYHMELTPDRLSEEDVQRKWIALKTDTLTQYTRELMEVVRAYRPKATFARNLYSSVVINREAGNLFSQDFDDFLNHYDYTVIMAYARMEGKRKGRATRDWFKKIWEETVRRQAQEKVVFKIQSYDWRRKRWIDEKVLQRELKFLLSQGVKHLAYYPDDVFKNKPELEMVYDLSAKRLP